MIIVCLTCNITLPRRRGSRPDGARYYLLIIILSIIKSLLVYHVIHVCIE